MAAKPLQFGLASLLWLVLGSAIIFGTWRYVRFASTGYFLVVLVTAIFAGPVVWLFMRPNPFRGRRRPAQSRSTEPAPPLENRLHQFMSNVTPAPISPRSDERTVALPTSIDGKPARTRAEVSGPLSRIRDAVASPSDADAK
jgi:hypothetical protein